MTATTADITSTLERGTDFYEDEVAIATSATLYIGALANFNAAGRLVDASNTAAQTFAGLVIEPLNDSGNPLSALTGNTAGTIKARIRWGHEVKLGVITSARTTTNLTKTAFVKDNQNVAGATNAGTALKRIPVGTIGNFTDSTKAFAYVKLTRTLGSTAALGA